MTTQRWRMLLWAAMLLVVGWIVWRARGALIPFAFGALLAYTLTPVVDVVAATLPTSVFGLLSSRRHQIEVYRRGVAVLLVYAVIGAGLFGAGSVIIPLAADQTVEFVNDLPTIIDDAQEQASDWLTQYRERVPDDVQERVDSYADDAGAALADRLEGVARRSVDLFTSTIVLIFGFAIVPFWMFYALRDRHTAGRNFMNAVPEPVRDDAVNVLAIADRLLVRYIRGQIFLGFIVGTAVGVGLTFMNVKFSLALGLIAGVTELIPIIGPWLGAVPGIVIVAATDPDRLIWVALLYVAVQQVENSLLVPRVQGRAADLHPAMVILLLVVAGAAFGFVGLVVVVPLAAILRELFWYADHRLGGDDAAEAFAASRAARTVEARPSLLGRLRRRLRASPPAEAPEPEGAEPEGGASGSASPGGGAS